MSSEMAVDHHRRPMTVDEYHRMAEAGIIQPKERVELIEGAQLLSEVFNRRAVVRASSSQSSLSPEPAVALLRWDPTGYAGHDPGPADALLLIEVGDSSRAYDRRVKLPLYARTGIPVHREPEGTAYGTNFVVRPGEFIAAQAFPDATIAVDEIVSP
jgi:Uma2 family endonuclease